MQGLRELLEISTRNGSRQNPILTPSLTTSSSQTDDVTLARKQTPEIPNDACGKASPKPTCKSNGVANGDTTISTPDPGIFSFPSAPEDPCVSSSSSSNCSPSPITLPNAVESLCLDGGNDHVNALSPLVVLNGVSESSWVAEQEEELESSEDEEVTFNTIKRNTGFTIKNPPTQTDTLVTSSSIKTNNNGESDPDSTKVNGVKDISENTDDTEEVPKSYSETNLSSVNKPINADKEALLNGDVSSED